KSRFTPFMSAISYGRIEIIKKLLELGVNIDAVDNKGFKAVDFARKMGKKRVLELLNKNKEK
ncbi:MAG: ankyrin repeat domain-containing protein, partial [Epsilonproteobacteria bacterium]|nr:ankyrin repeat domain-containing protein [Campylobacterota bacterium]